MGWIDHDNRPLVIVLVVLYAVPPIFSGGVQIMNLITQFAELKDIFPRLFVQQPYTLTTPYDYFVAGVPFLLCLLLGTNLKYNAPPKIGMPYVYGKRGNVYTLAKLRHESREGHAA